MYAKSIQYDRENRDYAMRLDGELVGFARTYHEAEVTLDQLVYELLSADPPSPEPPIVIVEAPDPTPPESCHACAGPHVTQRCPEVRAALFADDAPAVLIDVCNVLTMALDNRRAALVVPELRRIKARVEDVLS